MQRRTWMWNMEKTGKEIFSLYWCVYSTLLCASPSLQLSDPFPAFGPLDDISSRCSWKNCIVNPKAVKLTGAPSLVSWPQPSATVGASHVTACQPGHRTTMTVQTRLKPRFLMDICSHLGTTKGNKNVSPWTVQVLLNMCFGSKPNCAWLFYHCLFLSFTAFISYPHQTCEHCEGWVTQIVLLSAVKSIIRQQNPLISLLFRIPTQALKEKGTS